MASKLAWTAGLGHLPNLKTWALAARTDSRVKEITCRVFIFITCREQNRQHVGTVSFTSGGCSWTQCRRPHFWGLTTEGKSRRHVQMWRGWLRSAHLYVCRTFIFEGLLYIYGPVASLLITFFRAYSVFTCKSVIRMWSKCESLAPVQMVQHCSNRPISAGVHLPHSLFSVHSSQWDFSLVSSFRISWRTAR